MAKGEDKMVKLEWYRLYSDSEPIIEKELLNKILSTGSHATFALVRHEGEYKAMLYVNGKRINGPALPQPLSSPRDEVTHWMGNKPGVGLTTSEAETIIDAVNDRNERAGENRAR
jgi:phage gpG-like protein